MAHRIILTARQRADLFGLPTDETSMLRHDTLADEDLDIIRTRRRARNRFGFALQLCALRNTRLLLTPDEIIPEPIARFIAAQLGLRPDGFADYACRAETRREHLGDLRSVYSYKMFSGQGARDLKAWLATEAELARLNEDRPGDLLRNAAAHRPSCRACRWSSGFVPMPWLRRSDGSKTPDCWPTERWPERTPGRTSD